MAVAITRQMATQYKSSVAGGETPSSLHIRDVPWFIDIIDRTDVALLKRLGKPQTIDRLEIEWGQGGIVPRTATLGEALDNSDTTITLAAGHGVRFQLYDLVRVEQTGEIMLVTGISSDTITVTRGWGSTTGTAANNGGALRILGPAIPEGRDAVESPRAQGETFINYLQIFEYTFSMSHRARVTPTYEFRMDDRFRAELKKKMKEATLDLGDIAWHGVKNAGDGTGDTNDNPSTTGGLLEFTTTHSTNLNNDPIDLRTVMEGLQEVYDEVGMADMAKDLYVPMLGKRIFSSWFNEDRRYSKSDERAKISWTEVETDFGVIKVFVDWQLPNDTWVFVNTDDCHILNYEGGNWSTGTYATQGWYDKGFLRGDFGFRWEADNRRCKFVNVSTTLTDYPNLY